MRCLFALLLMAAGVQCADAAEERPTTGAPVPVTIEVHDDVVATIGPHFHGVHYDGPEHQSWDDVHGKLVTLPSAYDCPASRQALQEIGLSVARIFVKVQTTHPRPGEFDWAFLNRAMAGVLASGMTPMVCLHQGGAKWFVGDDAKPWWEFEAGRTEWLAFVRVCAERCRGKVGYYEVLNEPNHLHKDQQNYMGWDRTVDMFVETARVLKEIDADARCGGAATWAAWESAEWAKKVLAKPDGETLLDFVSYHLYTSHDLEDSNEKILAKTPWFEETPPYIRRELAEVTTKPIAVALTEFNTSAVCAKDGKPYTDPRNVNAFGGVLTALALMHSARGGCDLTMHFATIGGFGLLKWPPLYERRPVYYAVQLLHDVAGLVPGAKVLRTTTSEDPQPVSSAVRAELTTHDLEPFGVKTAKGTCAVLVNKTRTVTFRAAVALPAASDSAATYQYSPTRLPDALHPLAEVALHDGKAEVTCPPYSIVVVLSPAPKDAHRGGAATNTARKDAKPQREGPD